MNGTAIMQGIATVFIAQYFGVDLSVGQLLMVVLMVVMASVGAARVPGVGLLLAGVLASVGLLAEGIALILGVDRVLDMTRTAVNVTCDCTVFYHRRVLRAGTGSCGIRRPRSRIGAADAVANARSTPRSRVTICPAA